MALTERQKTEVRQQMVEPVEVLLTALVRCGFTVSEAAKAIRWATYVLEGRSAEAATRQA